VVDFVWRTTVRHKNAIQSMATWRPRERIICGVGWGRHSSSVSIGGYPSKPLHVVLGLQLSLLPLPLRRFLYCHPLLHPRLLLRLLLCPGLLLLSLSSRHCVVACGFLCSRSSRLFVVNAIGLFLKPLLIAANQDKLEITQDVEDNLSVL